MGPLLALAIWMLIVGLCTFFHRVASGQYWWSNRDDAVPVFFMGLPVILMISGLVAYVVLK